MTDIEICPVCEEPTRTFRGVLRATTLQLVIDDNNKLRTRIKELEAVLEKIADGDGCYTPAYATNCDAKCVDLARAALATSEDPSNG